MKKRKRKIVPQIMDETMRLAWLQEIDDRILDIVNEHNIPKETIISILKVISDSYINAQKEDLEWDLNDLLKDIDVKDVSTNYSISPEKPFSEN